MSNRPITIITELNRDEYAALTRPYSAARMRLMLPPVLLCVLISLVPTMLFAGGMTVSLHNLPPGPVATRFTNTLFAQLWPIYLAVQTMYLGMAGVRLWTILTRARANVKLLFPDRHRRETVTTQIASYGVIQSSAGSHIITPWGNIAHFDEIPEAFVLQSKNVSQGIWVSSVNLVYIPKAGKGTVASELSIDLLKQFRDASITCPNYIWQADLLSSSNKEMAANSVWPPPPDLLEPNTDIGIPLTGTIHLPTLQAKFDAAKLSLNYGPVSRLQVAQSSFVGPVILFINFYRFLSPAQLYLGVAGALALFGLSFAAMWFRKPLIVINNMQSLYMQGIRFTRISELQAITVVDSEAIYLFRKARKPVYITVIKTTGKSRRLTILGFPSAYEINLAATILGQFLTETKYHPQS